MSECVRCPARGELREAAVAALETAEVDAVKMAEGPARLRREVRVAGRAARVVETDPACFTVHVDEAGEKAGATNGDLAAGEVACDRRELILLPDPLLVSSEAERREGADDDEENRDAAHSQRIGTAPDGLDFRLSGSEPLSHGFQAERSGFLGHPFPVVEIAPRYSAAILEAVRKLDDRSQPMAEVARRVGAAAAELGLPKPSYVHLRRLIVAHRERQDAERARRDEIREILYEAYLDLNRSRVVNAYVVADRIRDAGR